MKKILIIALLALTACQKDYYLSDLNEANAQIELLNSERSSLHNQVNNISNELEKEIQNNVAIANWLIDILDSFGVSNFGQLHDLVDNSYSQAEVNALRNEITALENELKNLPSIEELEAYAAVQGFNLEYYHAVDFYGRVKILNRTYRNHLVDTAPPNMTGYESVLLGDINSGNNIFGIQLSWKAGVITTVSISQPNTNINGYFKIQTGNYPDTEHVTWADDKYDLALKTINFLKQY